MLFRAGSTAVDVTDEEIAAFNELQVIPFNRVVGQECQSPAPEEIPDCRLLREYPPHPYSYLPKDELLALSETDPVAAVMMGDKMFGAGHAKQLEMYLRAAALSEKPGPILRFDANGINMGNGNRLSLHLVAFAMGDPRADPAGWKQILEQLDPHNIKQTVATAYVEAEKMLRYMSRVQTEVTGSIQIRSLSDA